MRYRLRTLLIVLTFVGGLYAGIVPMWRAMRRFELACTAHEKNVAALSTWTAEIGIEDFRKVGLANDHEYQRCYLFLQSRLAAWTCDWLVTKSMVVREAWMLPGYTGSNEAELSLEGLFYKFRVTPQSEPFIVTSLGTIDRRAGDFEQPIVPHQLFWYGGIDSFSARAAAILEWRRSVTTLLSR